MLVDDEVRWLEKIQPWRLSLRGYVILRTLQIAPEPPRWDL